MLTGGTSFKKPNPSDYLDIYNLQDNTEYEKLGYLFNVNTGTTKSDSGFYTFFIKDVNGLILTSFLFNVKDFVESGVIASRLKKRPVKISFFTKELNGDLVGNIKEITEHLGDFDYDKFLGVVDDLSTLKSKYKSYLSIMSEDNVYIGALLKDDLLPQDSISDFYGGKIGGAYAFYSGVLRVLASLEDRITRDLASRVFTFTFHYLCDFKLSYADPVLSDKMHTFMQCQASMMYGLNDDSKRDATFEKYVGDTLSGLLGVARSELYIGKLIQDAYQYVAKSFTIESMNKTMIRGGRKRLDNGEVLIKL